MNALERDIATLRILTFNRHEPYICELAKTGHGFDVLLVDRPPWGKQWDVRSRPIPSNVRIVGEAEQLSSLDVGAYDLLLAQSYADFELIAGLPQRKVVLLHSVATLAGPDGVSRAEALRRLYQEQQLASAPIVYVSQYVADNWGLPGTIIGLAVDPSDFRSFAYTGKIAAALTVAHFFKERDALTGYSMHRQVVQDDIPHKVVGHNPTLTGSGPAKDWDELRSYYRDYRVYLNTTTGWAGATAMIEAMAAGMPVVTTPGPPGDTPQKLVIDGCTGFVSDDLEYLREKLKLLLADREMAEIMGQRAKEAVIDRYGIERFVQAWRGVLDETANVQLSAPRPVGSLPRTYYEKAGLVSDGKASRGTALCWSVSAPEEHLLYGPFVCLPPGRYGVTFFLGVRESSSYREWADAFLHARFSRFRPTWGAGDPLAAIVDVCSGPEARIHARLVIHRSHSVPWRSYRGFRLTFDSNGEKLFQFRVLATGVTALYVDPYRTWASIEALEGKA
jgi:hypothetical protein